MERDREEIHWMRAGVRQWILRAGRSGRGLREVSPAMLLSLLCAAAFGPVLAVAAGVTAGAAVAGIGVLSSVGGGVLGDVVAGALERLRREAQGHTPSQDELEAVVARQIELMLGAGGAQAQILRAEIATMLREIDAGETVLRAAVESGNEQMHDDIVSAIAELGADFAELRFLLLGIGSAAAEILDSLGVQDAKLRVIIDQNSRQATEARLTRESVAAIELRTRTGAAGETAAQGSAVRWVDGCPYRGLLPFDEAHAEVFYGRERLTAELVGKLAAGGLVIVTGASGAGKSSLLRAGLLPALARGLQLPGSERWPRMVITPTRDPLTELAMHLAVLGGSDTATVRDELVRRPSQADVTVRQAVMADANRRAGEARVCGDPDASRWC